MKPTFAPSARHRHGISLLEVIACTALLAVILLPIAGIIRASGHSLRQAQQGSTSANLRSTLNWLRQTIDEGQIVSVASNSLQMRLSDGRMARVFVDRNELVLDDGTDRIQLAEDVRDIRFQNVHATLPPRNRVGLRIQMRGTDPASGQLVSVEATVAETPQI